MTRKLQFAFRQLALPGERYAPEAFDTQIGRTIAIKADGKMLGTGKLIAAKVEEDGLSVFLTLEMDAITAADLLVTSLSPKTLLLPKNGV